jgi:hypothetical protein
MKLEQIMTRKQKEEIMKRVEKRRENLRSQVRGVCQGFTSALFVWGPGGLGKSHVIVEEVDGLCGKGWEHHKGFSTARGMFLDLAERPDVIHVYEDCENLYKNATAASLLRETCGAPKQRDRTVSYRTNSEDMCITFRGGVIIVSNENLSRLTGPLAAVASRFRPVEWSLSVEERMAVISDIAESPWVKGQWFLKPVECQRVARWLIEEMASGQTGPPVDIRFFVEHGLPAYAQFLSSPKDDRVDWREILRAKMKGSVCSALEDRATRNARLEAIALRLAGRKDLDTSGRVAAWRSETGLGQAIYYRHLKAAQAR